MARTPAVTASDAKRKEKKKGRAKKEITEEKVTSKSPAEFFAENQSIAGFDNPGKSLYTTLRELVENSLDACESGNILPDISIKIEEMTQKQFNDVRGISNAPRIDGEGGGDGVKDFSLFTSRGSAKKKKNASIADAVTSTEENSQSDAAVADVAVKKEATEKPTKLTTPSKGSEKLTKLTTPSKGSKKEKSNRGAESYFRVIVKDNGCGMAHDAIPDLLGRVLSGSKYGVRQTRGKFGLGAKMALIWSKKSTGVPIKVVTSHMFTPKNQKQSKPPSTQGGDSVTTCVLDIDIYKNEPRIISHTKEPNAQKWVGTEISVVIAGNWTTYKSRIVQYLQQLAIITPYARLELEYCNLSDEKKSMGVQYDRRSEQMPPPAKEVKYHPSSVNNLLIQQLLSKSQNPTLLKFLCNDLSSITPQLARRVISEIQSSLLTESTPPSSLSDKQITQLVQILRSVLVFKPPDGSCLSPLGEYNLNLGIRKVIEPDYVATFRDKPSAYEGHPFIVEAAVSLGAKNAREGITVVRFANRIPLLFEAGADVVTRVAQNKIKWSLYKIDHKRDRIGVFVSIVSTKVPFKGTGKEYIGDDIVEIQGSVKRALQGCCQQLRSFLMKRNALKERKERRSRLLKYIPDVGRAVFGILDQMKKRQADGEEEEGVRKRLKLGRQEEDILKLMKKKEISEDSIKSNLMAAVELHNMLEDAEGAGGGSSGLTFDAQGKKTSTGSSDKNAQPVYLVPIVSDELMDGKNDIDHPLFTFRPLQHLVVLDKEDS